MKASYIAPVAPKSESRHVGEFASHIGRTGVSTFDASSRRRVTAGVLALLLVLGSGAYLLDRWLQGQLQQAVARELLATHRGQVEALRLWASDRRRMALAAADTRRVRRAAARIMEATTDDQAMLAMVEEGPSISEVAWNYEFTGWALVRPDGTGFGFTDRPVVSDLKVQQINALSAALSGEASLSEPLVVERREGTEAAFADDKPAMFAGAPLRAAPSNQPLGLVFRIDPEQHFARILESSRVGSSEETYAVNRAGVMVSSSRFDDQRAKLGVDTKGAVTDPGGDLTRGYRPSLPREQWPLTRAVSAVTRGHAGNSLEPYRDHRGVPVVGIWSWIPSLQIGAITEMAASDAFVVQRAVRTCFWILGALLIGGAVSLFITSTRAKRLAAKVGAAEQLGQYRLVRKIGEGGMGTVYLAEHALLRRPTALKVCTPDKNAPELLQRFEREVQVTAQLSHPNTVRVYDYGRQTNGVFYYVMELIEGIDLDALVLQHGPLPLARAIHIMHQLAGSLAEAHGCGVVHRDVKPANIMLTRRGGVPDFVKVLDFGLARTHDSTEKLTQAGHLLGTPLYMAPEVLNGTDNASPRSDIYAAGCVMFFLLTGKDAFSATTVTAIMSRHASGNPMRLSQEMVGTCPHEVSELVHRCISFEPSARYADGVALSEALESLALAYPWTIRNARAAWDQQRVRAEQAATLAADLGSARIARTE